MVLRLYHENLRAEFAQLFAALPYHIRTKCQREAHRRRQFARYATERTPVRGEECKRAKFWAVKEGMSETVRAKMLSTAVAQHRVIRRFGKTAEGKLRRGASQRRAISPFGKTAKLSKVTKIKR